jgi:hypothetical protein
MSPIRHTSAPCTAQKLSSFFSFRLVHKCVQDQSGIPACPWQIWKIPQDYDPAPPTWPTPSGRYLSHAPAHGCRDKPPTEGLTLSAVGEGRKTRHPTRLCGEACPAAYMRYTVHPAAARPRAASLAYMASLCRYGDEKRRTGGRKEKEGECAMTCCLPWAMSRPWLHLAG